MEISDFVRQSRNEPAAPERGSLMRDRVKAAADDMLAKISPIAIRQGVTGEQVARQIRASGDHVLVHLHALAIAGVYTEAEEAGTGGRRQWVFNLPRPRKEYA